jgi:hypothetical protein
MNQPSKDEKSGSWLILDKHVLEADLAFFAARLELLGRPSTVYQHAQRRTFEILQTNLGETLNRLQRRTRW